MAVDKEMELARLANSLTERFARWDFIFSKRL